ncbi:TPA: 30S ribosomal protein S15 [Candidatus Woesearchaeota archaeon]|nr:30S ribosomal protein S15 [Candidatus Woesearchaeota archaeon]
MARMHSHARGQSRSTKPSAPTKPTWLAQSAKETELLVVKYAKDGKSPSQIGLHLRDEYGIPSVKLVTGKSVAQILKEKTLQTEIPEDVMALVTKVVKIKKHQDENKKDMTAIRGLRLTESKINRLVKYYKTTGRLPADWSYDPDRIKLYVE